MKSKQQSIYNAEFLKKFTLAVIQVVERQKLNVPETKEIVDADIIPELSQELLRQYALNKKLIEEMRRLDKQSITKSQMPKRRAPLVATKVQTPPVAKTKKQALPMLPTDEKNGFQKIKPLLNDYSVSRIRATAPNRPVVIIRSGQRQPTKIVLSQIQITQVFEHIAELAHIPLIEGPFKVTLKDYNINGINSNITGSRFIIQKETAYSMLEKQKGGQKTMPPPRRHK
jgi:hypothetical protein